MSTKTTTETPDMKATKGDRFGLHRVIEPQGVLTQAAWKIVFTFLLEPD